MTKTAFLRPGQVIWCGRCCTPVVPDAYAAHQSDPDHLRREVRWPLNPKTTPEGEQA